MTHADNPHPLQPGLKGEPIADRSEEGRATERSKELDAQIASDKEEPICSRKHKEEPIDSHARGRHLSHWFETRDDERLRFSHDRISPCWRIGVSAGQDTWGIASEVNARPTRGRRRTAFGLHVMRTCTHIIFGNRRLIAYEDYAHRTSQRVWLRMGAHELPACQEWDLNDDSEGSGHDRTAAGAAPTTRNTKESNSGFPQEFWLSAMCPSSLGSSVPHSKLRLQRLRTAMLPSSGSRDGSRSPPIMGSRHRR